MLKFNKTNENVRDITEAIGHVHCVRMWRHTHTRMAKRSDGGVGREKNARDEIISPLRPRVPLSAAPRCDVSRERSQYRSSDRFGGLFFSRSFLPEKRTEWTTEESQREVRFCDFFLFCIAKLSFF